MPYLHQQNKAHTRTATAGCCWFTDYLHCHPAGVHFVFTERLKTCTQKAGQAGFFKVSQFYRVNIGVFEDALTVDGTNARNNT